MFGVAIATRYDMANMSRTGTILALVVSYGTETVVLLIRARPKTEAFPNEINHQIMRSVSGSFPGGADRGLLLSA